LDAFYDRILLDIEGDEDQEYARLALQWLAIAARPLKLEELVEAVIIRPQNEPYVDDEDRFMEYKDILEVLPSGLVSIVIVPRGSDDEIDEDSGTDDSSGEEGNDDECAEEVATHQYDDDHGGSGPSGGSREEEAEAQYGGNVQEAEEIGTKIMAQFAHFSVKEYLVSVRIVDGPALKYHISEISAHRVYWRILLCVLNLLGQPKAGDNETNLYRFSTAPLCGQLLAVSYAYITIAGDGSSSAKLGSGLLVERVVCLACLGSSWFR
jgi:hypothetical protein